MKTTELHPEQIEELRKNHRGVVLHPGDDKYDSAHRIWNGMIDKYPFLYARGT